MTGKRQSGKAGNKEKTLSDNDKKSSVFKRMAALGAAGSASLIGVGAALPKQNNIPPTNSVPSIIRQTNLPRQPNEVLKNWTKTTQDGMSTAAELRKSANETKQNLATSTKANLTGQSKAYKGIEAFRQKSAEKSAGTSTGKSTNKGIASYQSKASGQSTGTSRSSGASKGSSASSGKSGGSSSGGQSSGSGQSR